MDGGAHAHLAWVKGNEFHLLLGITRSPQSVESKQVRQLGGRVGQGPRGGRCHGRVDVLRWVEDEDAALRGAAGEGGPSDA